MILWRGMSVRGISAFLNGSVSGKGIASPSSKITRSKQGIFSPVSTHLTNGHSAPRPQHPARLPVSRGVNPWLIRLPILFFTSVILLILLLILLLGLFRLAYQNRITPGVYVYGVNLSGMTRAEAIAALSENLTYPDTAVFTFRDQSSVWQMTAAEVGVSFDLAETAKRALAVGHGGNLLRDLLDQAQVWFNGESIAPVAYYNQSIAAERLAAIANQVNRPPYDAVLVVDGATVTATPGQSGYALDIAATQAQLDQAIWNWLPGAEISLVTAAIPSTVWNVDEAAAQIRAALSGPLVLTATDARGETLGPWTIDVAQIAASLAVVVTDQPGGGRYAQVEVDLSGFTDSLNQLAPGLILYPQNGRFHFNDNTGQLEVIQPSVSGRELDVAATLDRLEQAVFRSDDRNVPIAFTYTLPRYHDAITAAELGITQMVVEATTYYTGSGANRRQNIALGASRFDGIIIGPGEEFSFNDWLGEVSLENGFVESKVIEGERTTNGVGGGICQVSTTAFRAAFFGGYFIIERNSHAYRVGFYELNNTPPGLDASIWSPERDFRFQNDTPYHLLIETSVYPANDALQFRFYSTNPGRTVEVEAPVTRDIVPPLATVYEANSELQLGESVYTDWAVEGADVTVTRIIRDLSGNEIRRDSIYTHYLPWRAVIQVAPGDPRLTTSSP